MNTVFDDIKLRESRLVGTVTFEFEEQDDGQWYSIVVPKMMTTIIREVYKLALIVAVLQDTCKTKLAGIDRMIMNNKEIAEYHNMMVEEKKNKPAGGVDIDKYQMQLPFKGKGPESE